MRRLLSICLFTTLVLAFGSPVHADGDDGDDGDHGGHGQHGGHGGHHGGDHGHHGHGDDDDHGRGDVFSVTPYDDDYAFTDDCGFDVMGNTTGVDTLYNVRGSDGQAFLDDNKFSFEEVWSNATGGTATASGEGRFRETKARHVDGDIWEFTQVLKGKPLTVRDSDGKVVLAEHGYVVFKVLFDTLGDSQPGGDVIEEKIVKIRGDFPTLDPDFDFCAFANDVLG